MMKITKQALGAMSALLLTAIFAAPVAQAQQAAPAAQDALQYKADKITIRTNGVRLDGNAEIKALPQLETRANAIAFDYVGNQITEVRALGKVNLKVNFVPKGGGKLTRIESTSDSATLKPQTRELTLTGNVDGFLQPEGAPRTTLAGKKIVLNYIGQELNGDISGPIKLVVPPETVQGSGASSAQLGAVTITSREAKIDGNAGVVRFIGDARAVSAEGSHQFDVAAREFVLTRSQQNTIDILKTEGRTKVKIDLPEEAAKSTSGSSSQVGALMRVEAEADSAVISRQTNTLVFDGNVTGFYFLAPTQQGGVPQKYDFLGSRAVIRQVPESEATAENPAGLQADITGEPGKPVEVSTPAFGIDLGK